MFMIAEKTNLKNKGQELKKIKQAAKISIKEGAFASLMEGFGVRYISPYALFLGASNFQIGLLSSLPSLLGNLAQLPFLHLMKNHSRKKIVFTAVLLQAVLWLPLIAIGFFYFSGYLSPRLTSNLLIIIYSLIIIAGTSANSPWNSWMKDIIQRNNGEYFGKKNRITNIVITVGMLLAGIILNFFEKERAFRGFLIIFFIAFLGRAISSYLLTRQYEPKFKYEEKAYFTFRQFVKKMFFNNFGRFVILFSLVSFASAVAGPFFAVYMLRDLNLSYINYTFVTLSSALIMIIFMPILGKSADKYGNIKVLKITGFLIPLIPIIWLGSILVDKLEINFILLIYLMFTEGFAGFAWAGFNLSAANFIYDAVSKEKMAFCVAYFNLLNAFCVFLGAMMGGIIVSNKEFIFGINALLFVFIISALLRLLVIILMNPFIKEVRTVPEFNLRKKIIEKFQIKNIHVIKMHRF